MITAIETRYAGCRFRSRLEARWAAFFDHLDIQWEYEAQGYECDYRLSLDEGTFRYLPDFWLPQQEIHAEVKGSLTEDELVRLVDAAASLSSNNGGGCHDSGGHDLIVLGPIPRDGIVSPFRLHMHKGDLFASEWNSQESGGSCPGGSREMIFASDYGGGWNQIGLKIGAHGIGPTLEAEIAARYILGGYRMDSPNLLFEYAYAAARSARFEHGAGVA